MREETRLCEFADEGEVEDVIVAVKDAREETEMMEETVTVVETDIFTERVASPVALSRVLRERASEAVLLTETVVELVGIDGNAVLVPVIVWLSVPTTLMVNIVEGDEVSVLRLERVGAIVGVVVKEEDFVETKLDVSELVTETVVVASADEV